MQHTDKARAEFEAWRLANFCGGVERLKKCSNAPDVYYYTAEQEAWTAWQASRASVVVELPEPREGRRTYLDDDARDEGWNDCLAECREALEATGLTVKE